MKLNDITEIAIFETILTVNYIPSKHKVLDDALINGTTVDIDQYEFKVISAKIVIPTHETDISILRKEYKLEAVCKKYVNILTETQYKDYEEMINNHQRQVYESVMKAHNENELPKRGTIR